jgi:aldose 1-epimerase
MSFNVYTRENNGLEQLILEDNSAGTQVIILPQNGAALHAFEIKTASGKHNIIDNYENAGILEQNVGKSYKSSKLSPFVCRIKDGKYTFDGSSFEFPNKFTDLNAIHGLIFNSRFEVKDSFADDAQAYAVMQYNYQATDAGYPFTYECAVRYALLPGNLLQVQTTATNTHKTSIPLADGWHPYFSLGGKINDWTMQFNAEAMVEFDERLIPTGRLVPYNWFETARPIEDVTLDNCFLLKKVDELTACSLYNPANRLRIDFMPDISYPYLQIYTPPHRESIAVENLSGAPDCFNNKMGLTILPPGQSRTFTVHYKVSAE